MFESLSREGVGGQWGGGGHAAESQKVVSTPTDTLVDSVCTPTLDQVQCSDGVL